MMREIFDGCFGIACLFASLEVAVSHCKLVDCSQADVTAPICLTNRETRAPTTGRCRCLE